jgi:cell wall-associated NlpC family hydrolase
MQIDDLARRRALSRLAAIPGGMDFESSAILDPSQVEFRPPAPVANLLRGYAQRGAAWELPNWGDAMPPGTIPTLAPTLAGIATPTAPAGPTLPLGPTGASDPLRSLLNPLMGAGSRLQGSVPGFPGVPGTPAPGGVQGGALNGFDDFDSADLQALKEIKPGSLKGTAAAVRLAETQIGTPYVFGSTDCSGLTKWVFSRLGVELPHNAQAQMQMTQPVSAEEARPGDLVYMNFGRLAPGIADHVMIYAGNGRAIGSQPSTNGVGYYQDITGMPVLGFGRIPGSGASRTPGGRRNSSTSRRAPAPSSPRPAGPRPERATTPRPSSSTRRRRRGGSSSYVGSPQQR